MALAPSESENISNGKSMSKSSCWSSKIVHLACLAQAVSAMYSASVDESATVHCLRVVQETQAPVKMKQKPVVERRVSVSEANWNHSKR